MRTTEWTGNFTGDYKKALKTPTHRDISSLIETISEALARDERLAAKYRDHALKGNYTGHRECHLKPDLLLIYKKPDESTLRLVRLGSHSELF